MGKPLGFKPIDGKHFRERIQDNFSSGYLTLISIIQGVAFGIWITNINDAFDLQTFHSYQVIYPFLSFFGIIFIFYYYSWFVSIVYTLPNLRESVVPLVLAAAEVAPMYFFDQPQYWWLFTGIFFAAGSIAFLNTLLALRNDNYATDFRQAVSLARIETYSNIILSIIMSLLCFWAWNTYPENQESIGSLPAHDMVFLVFLVPLMLFMTAKSQFWFLNKIYLISGLRREKT